jgi:hypothetical protein
MEKINYPYSITIKYPRIDSRNSDISLFISDNKYYTFWRCISKNDIISLVDTRLGNIEQYISYGYNALSYNKLIEWIRLK